MRAPTAAGIPILLVAAALALAQGAEEIPLASGQNKNGLIFSYTFLGQHDAKKEQKTLTGSATTLSPKSLTQTHAAPPRLEEIHVAYDPALAPTHTRNQTNTDQISQLIGNEYTGNDQTSNEHTVSEHTVSEYTAPVATPTIYVSLNTLSLPATQGLHFVKSSPSCATGCPSQSVSDAALTSLAKIAQLEAAPYVDTDWADLKASMGALATLFTDACTHAAKAIDKFFTLYEKRIAQGGGYSNMLIDDFSL